LYHFIIVLAFICLCSGGAALATNKEIAADAEEQEIIKMLDILKDYEFLRQVEFYEEVDIIKDKDLADETSNFKDIKKREQ